MRTETLIYQADGLTMHSIFHVSDNGPGAPRPGVLVFPEAPGLGDHAKRRARQLADLGYAALACDFYGEGKYNANMAEIMPMIAPMRDNPLICRARAMGAYDALRARPEVDASKIAAIGYCFGGTMSFELARSGTNLAAAVCFHGGLATARPEDAGNIKAKMLACIGADDPFIQPEERLAFEREMRAGGVDWQLHLYGGVVHSFTNPEADAMGMPDTLRYDAGADARSWASMRQLFDEIFA